MASPALRMFECARKPTHFKRHRFHGQQVGIHALALIEPTLLAPVFCQGFQFQRVDRSRIHECARNDPPPQGVAQTVRHAMVDRQFLVRGGPMRLGP